MRHSVLLLPALALASQSCERIADCVRSLGASCAAIHLGEDAAARSAAATLVAALNDAETDDDGCYKPEPCEKSGGRGVRGRDDDCDDPVEEAWAATGGHRTAIEAYTACVDAGPPADDTYHGMACEDICQDPCGGDVDEENDDSALVHDKKTCSELCQCYFQCPAENEIFFYDLASVNATDHPLDVSIAPVGLTVARDDVIGAACRKAYAKDVEDFTDEDDLWTKQSHFKGKERDMLCKVLIQSKMDYDYRKFHRLTKTLRVASTEL